MWDTGKNASIAYTYSGIFKCANTAYDGRSMSDRWNPQIPRATNSCMRSKNSHF